MFISIRPGNVSPFFEIRRTTCERRLYAFPKICLTAMVDVHGYPLGIDRVTGEEIEAHSRKHLNE